MTAYYLLYSGPALTDAGLQDLGVVILWRHRVQSIVLRSW